MATLESVAPRNAWVKIRNSAFDADRVVKVLSSRNGECFVHFDSGDYEKFLGVSMNAILASITDARANNRTVDVCGEATRVNAERR